jgi:hypothetical protein
MCTLGYSGRLTLRTVRNLKIQSSVKSLSNELENGFKEVQFAPTANGKKTASKC